MKIEFKFGTKSELTLKVQNNQKSIFQFSIFVQSIFYFINNHLNLSKLIA